MALDKTLLEAHNTAQRAYYENRDLAGNRRVAVKNTLYIRDHIGRFIAFSELSFDERILDIGCGMGKYTLLLLEHGYSVEALDISHHLLEQLAAAAKDKFQVPIHCADVLQPKEELHHRFDVVTGFFMLHHLIDIDEAFGKMKKFLSNNGRVAFLDVNPLCPLYYLQISLTPGMSWKAERGILNLTRKRLLTGLSSAGFKNCRIENFGLLPPALKNRPRAALLERGFDAIPFFKPFAAFQLISAEL